MILAEKVMNIKVVELIKIYNFSFGHLSGYVTTTMSDDE
jgi:hypothetical protein